MFDAQTYLELVNSLRTESRHRQERRNDLRVAVAGSVDIVVRVAGEQQPRHEVARVRDVSKTGISLMIRMVIPRGSTVVVIFRAEEGEPVAMLGEVKRQVRVHNACYVTGVRLHSRLDSVQLRKALAA